jgi:hypothetical protein
MPCTQMEYELGEPWGAYHARVVASIVRSVPLGPVARGSFTSSARAAGRPLPAPHRRPSAR